MKKEKSRFQKQYIPQCKLRTSVKEHTCKFCDKAIPKGTKYFVVTKVTSEGCWRESRYFRDFKYHKTCYMALELAK